MQMYSDSCATLAFGNQTSALPNGLKSSKTLPQNPQHWKVLGAAQSVSWMPFAEAVLNAPEKVPTDSPRTRRQTPCPGGRSKLGGRADKGSPAPPEACVKFDRKASLQCRNPKSGSKSDQKCVRNPYTGSVRPRWRPCERARILWLCVRNPYKNLGQNPYQKLCRILKPKIRPTQKKIARANFRVRNPSKIVYGIRTQLCVRIPYKNVNEKRPQKLPKRTPETRQIGYLEKAPKPHK